MDVPLFPRVADPLSNPPPLAPTYRSSAEEDTALLQRVQRRDQGAMAALFDRYSGLAYSIALRVLNDPAQAEDVMQDIFFQLWQRPSAFTPERGSLGAWLAVIARNRAIDALRRRKPSDPVEDLVLAGTADMASDLERATTVQRVREVLSTMPVELRETMELAFFQGLTHAEIAEEQGQPLGTVKTRIRSALINLRKALQA